MKKSDNDVDINVLTEFLNKDYIQELNKLVNNNLFVSNNGNFNIFSFISSKYYREDFHSNVLALILSPNHPPVGTKDNLIQFLRCIGINELSWKSDFWCTNSYDIKVEREKLVKLGRVDIIITIESDDEKKVVIIENKLNGAQDQEKQLLRYFKSFNDSEILKLVYVPNFTVSIDDLVKKHDIENYRDKLVILSSVSSSFSNLSLQSFLEEIKKINKEKEDSILREKFISDYIELIRSSFGKGPIMEEIQKIFDDIDKKNEIQKFAEGANKVLSCWNRRADFIFNFVVDNQDFSKLDLKKSNIYSAPYIWWKEKDDNYGVYIQGEHQSFIQIGFYFKDLKMIKKDVFEKNLTDCLYPHFNDLPVYCSGTHWMFCNIENELLDTFKSFNEIALNISDVLKKLIEIDISNYLDCK